MEESQDTNEHTRIYKMTDPTIQLSELSIPVNSNTQDDNKEKSDSENNANEPIPDENKTDSLTGNNEAVGLSYPLIRIADHYFG
jgi:hypothetical protein